MHEKDPRSMLEPLRDCLVNDAKPCRAVLIQTQLAFIKAPVSDKT